MSAAEPANAPASASQLPAGITDPNYKPLPGRLGNLTVPQQHALDTLKKELEAEGKFVPERMDDAYLLRCVMVTVSYHRVRSTCMDQFQICSFYSSMLIAHTIPFCYLCYDGRFERRASGLTCVLF